MSEDLGFDPAELFRRSRAGRPVRPIRRGPSLPRWQRVVAGLLVVVLVVISAGAALVGLRVRLLFLESLGHANVFWTPIVAQVVLFLLGLAITGGIVGACTVGWVAVAANLDRNGPRAAAWAGGLLAVVAGIAGGAFLAAQWQDVLLFLHAHSFGRVDLVFHEDYGFFVFRLPVYDELQALLWAGVILGLLGTLALAALCLLVETTPEEIPLPLRPPPGRSPSDGLRVATIEAGGLLVAVFILAALGAHFGVYHLATTQHDNFVGLDATQRDVVRPVLGGLQWLALALAAITAIVVVRRRRKPVVPTAIVLGSLLGGWLVVAGLLQTIPAAVYSAARVAPNASTLQLPPIADFLSTSRDAWGLEPGVRVESRSFSHPVPPTVADLEADPGTLRNIRIQDPAVLPEVFAQIDRTRSYQTYPTITVDRYPGPDGQEQEVMLGPREIAASDIPAQGFVNRTFQFTHGYGITAASVNRVASEGKPDLLAGNQPQRLLAPDAPPQLAVADPRLYCGMATTQPVVVNTAQPEFDYLGGGGEVTNRYGDQLPGGMPVPGGLDRVAMSLGGFGGLDLLLTNSLRPDSRIFLHREIRDRVATVAPFLRLDADPYVVADPASGHLVWILDAYLATDRFPESFRQDDGTSYMRNAVKVTIDARTCETTLYAVDANEPLTATWNEVFPGLFTPIERMPASLRAHLRYPEDLFRAQAIVYTAAHIDPSRAIDLFNKGDLFRIAQETIGTVQQDTRPVYVEMTVPGDSGPSFVLLQTFSPAQNPGGGGASNILTAMLMARSDYSPDNHFRPKLVAIRLNAGDNVLGPQQFDNNINTDRDISSAITLLNQHGSQVVLGSVIVLPINSHSFLYVRPLYVQAANGSFPQLRFVLTGTQDRVAMGATLADSLEALFGQPVPGAPDGVGTPAPGASPSPSPSPTPSPGGVVLSPEVLRLIQDLLRHEAAAQADLQRGDYTAYGQDEARVKADLDQLRSLLGPDVTLIPASPSPSSAGSSTPPPSTTPRP